MEQFHEIIKEVNVNNFQSYVFNIQLFILCSALIIFKYKVILVTITLHGGIC